MRLFSVITLLLMLSSRLFSEARVSVGYGLQLSSMLNTMLDPAVAALVLNSNGRPLKGQSAGTDYQASWSGATDEMPALAALVSLPELRLSADWKRKTWSPGVFASLTGMVPQTLYYYTGAYQLTEGRTCSGIDYANCPLAALNFVSSSGKGSYETEVRTNLRSFAGTIGFSLAKNFAALAGGDLSVLYELGISMQTFTATTQFTSVRCSNGAPPPCAQINQLRVGQGEMSTVTQYAYGPHLGITVRYERPKSWWFVEFGASATLLFGRLQHSGYTNFVASGTVAFTQTSTALGVDAVQDFFAVLPALSIRAGIRL